MSTVTASTSVAPDLIEDEVSLHNLGRSLLSEQAYTADEQLVGTVVEVDRKPVVFDVTETPDGPSLSPRAPGYAQDGSFEETAAWIVTWEAFTGPRQTTEAEVGVVVEDDPTVEGGKVAFAAVPAPVVEALGGEVNIRHGFGGPVTITYRDAAGRQIESFGIYVEVDDDVVEAHVPAEAKMAVIVPVPEDTSDDEAADD